MNHASPFQFFYKVQHLYLIQYIINSKLFQVSDSLFYRRVGAEELAHHVGELALEGDGLHDEELGNVFSIDLSEARIAAYLAQSRSQSQRVAAKLGATCICHVLALTADGKPCQQGEEVTYRSQDDGNQDDGYDASAILAVATGTAIASTIDEGVPKHTNCKAEGCAHDAYEDDADDEQTCVAIADVRQLVADYASQFVVVQAIANACCDCYGVALLVYSACEGIELRVVDDVYLWYRQ